jgi:hypothetical protein
VLTTKAIPSHDWIANPASPRTTKFQGQLPILDVQTNWWYESVPAQGSNSDSTFWVRACSFSTTSSVLTMLDQHWFRSDNNAPWRTMNCTMDNPDNVPVLQDFAFIHWPTFTASSTRQGKPRESLGEAQPLPEAVLQLCELTVSLFVFCVCNY